MLCQFFLQILIIFDDSIMNKIDVTHHVWMRVALAWCSMGRPTSMANTNLVGGFIYCHLLFKLCYFTFLSKQRRNTLWVQSDDSCAIISAIFKSFKSTRKYLLSLFISYIAYDSAHGISFPFSTRLYVVLVYIR